MRDRIAKALAGSNWMRGLVVIGLVAFGVMLWVRFRIVPFHMLNMGGVDQNVVQGVLRILLGLPLYGDPEQAPFPIVQYAPVYFYLHAALAKVLGIGPDDVHGVYWSGRAFCLAINLATTWFVWRIARKLQVGRPGALLAAIFFFTALTDMYYIRPDAPYQLFVWWFVLAFLPVVDGSDRGNRRLAISGLLIALAIFTKQNAIVLPMMVAAWCAYQGQWKLLLRVAAWCVLWGAAGTGLLFLGNDPWATYANTILGNANGFDVGIMLSHLYGQYGLLISAWLIIGTGYAIHALRSRSNGRTAFIAVGFLVSAAWALFSALKRGGNTNYYTEPQVLAVLLVLVAWASEQKRGVPVAAKALLAVIALAGMVRSAMYLSATEITRYRRDEPVEFANAEALSARIRDHGLEATDHVFLLRRGYAEMLLAPNTILNAKDIVAASGPALRLDLSRFHALLKNGEVRYVIAPASARSDSLFYKDIQLRPYAHLFTQGDQSVFERIR